VNKTMAQPEPQTYAELLVPDAIEPIYGWKALQILPDGRLASPQQKVVWPVKQRLEASCHNSARPTSYQWKAVYGQPKPAPAEVGTSFQGGASFSSSASVSVSGPSGSMLVNPVDPPKTQLPHGMSWSWEPVEHEIASNNCRCGIYVVNDPRKCQSYIGENCILAEVCLWGRVVPGEEGARGQYAYPRQLFTPDTLTDVATMVAELYGVPIGYRDHKTGATITYRQAMENLAKLKAGINQPFTQAGPPTVVPKQLSSGTTALAVPPPPPAPPPIPVDPGKRDKKTITPPKQLSEKELGAYQAHKLARLITHIAWLAILLIWVCSILFSPYLLIGALPFFFAVIRNSRDDLAKKQDEW